MSSSAIQSPVFRWPAHSSEAAPPPPSTGLGYELVSAAFGHKNFGMGRIALDLLAQAVDMGLQSMVVTPEL